MGAPSDRSGHAADDDEVATGAAIPTPATPIPATRPPYGATAAVLLGAIAVSQAIPWAERAFGGNVPPLFARLHPSLGLWLLVALLVVVSAWWLLPRLLEAPRWAFLAGLVAFGWLLAVTLAAEAHGLHEVAAPLRRPLDYWANLPLVDRLGPRAFAERYPDLLSLLSLHARTHPPGAVLLLWMLSKVTGRNLTAVSLLIVAIGVAGAVPTYAVAREAYGERAARFAAVLFAVAPGVLLFSATSMDAVFMTVVAAALAAGVRAPRSTGWAAVTGALVALAACFTFGALTLGLVGIGVGAIWLMAHRRGTPPTTRAETNRRLAVLAFRGVVVLAGLAAGALVIRWVAGIDLPAVFRATLSAHLDDPSRARSYLYWVAGDVVAFLIVAGIPQTALAVDETRRRWRERRFGLESVLWGTIAVSSLSGLFLGEVDHIWLFFVPLLAAVAGGRLAALEREPGPRGAVATFRDPAMWALAQTVLMQVLLYTFW